MSGGRKRVFRGPRRRTAPGAAPGTLTFDADAPPAVLRVIGVSPERIREAPSIDVREIPRWLEEWPVVWIDLVGLGQGEELRGLGEHLGLHALALEDVANLGQRAKVESYESELFVVTRMAYPNDPATEQLSLFLGEGWVLTVQEREGDCFDAVRARLREDGRRIRSRGADYLAYALLDAVVDSYFPAIDTIGDHLDELEEVVLGDPDPQVAQSLHRNRRALISLRKSIVPHRDVFQSLSRDLHPLIDEETRLFLRDVYDHVLRINDLVDSFRELTGDLMATYMTVVSNRMNEVMKVLTIIATIFIPLGFIAGLYGMNFDPSVSPLNMPELGWRWGYPFALGLMLAVGGGFVLYMWRKGWLK
ncbi:MAG: magnesium/cobalt transporter CorA [Gemmatimonadota bacterium]|nr:magnesium/cobalt transporter CorA [Gemmatimonadota bacterium]